VPQSKLWPVEAAVTYHSTQRRIQSPNVAGVLRGTDPDLREEFIVCTAHLDGLGLGAPIKGDSINNGAMDNAIGVSILIETAHVLAQARPGLKRSVLFLAVTAEEKGLLGSDYFAAHPTVPLRQIIANVNIDMPILLYPLADIIAFGAARGMKDVPFTLSKIPLATIRPHAQNRGEKDHFHKPESMPPLCAKFSCLTRFEPGHDPSRCISAHVAA
jgi:Zn-dependent M28 family amino/carboxypeptidase